MSLLFWVSSDESFSASKCLLEHSKRDFMLRILSVSWEDGLVWGSFLQEQYELKAFLPRYLFPVRIHSLSPDRDGVITMFLFPHMSSLLFYLIPLIIQKVPSLFLCLFFKSLPPLLLSLAWPPKSPSFWHPTSNSCWGFRSWLREWRTPPTPRTNTSQKKSNNIQVKYLMHGALKISHPRKTGYSFLYRYPCYLPQSRAGWL